MLCLLFFVVGGVIISGGLWLEFNLLVIDFLL